MSALCRIAAAFAWLWAARHLSTEWRVNEQYHYAWGVLPLALWMCSWRPLAYGEKRPRLAHGIATLAAFTFLLGELLRWHDPLWRLTGGLLFGGAAAFTAAMLLARGGWLALRSRLFPLAFAATALPWPVPLELAVTQRLLHLVSTGATTCANLLGTAATQRGNIIEVRGGLVGIEAACSGVQSLQASLMAALFFGEFLALPTARRLALLALGAACALAINFARVLALTLLTAAHGEAAALAHHDTIGLAATLATFLLLYVAGRVLARVQNAPLQTSNSELRTPNSEPSPVQSSEFEVQSSEFKTASLAIVLTPLLVWLWFTASAEKSPPPSTPRWQPAITQISPGWQAITFPPGPREAALLRYTRREGLRLLSPSGQPAWLVHFWWEPENSLPGPAFTHTPALCLPWAGWAPRGPAEPITLHIAGSDFPALAARFEQEGVALCAIQILSAAGQIQTPETDPARLGARLPRLTQLWRAPRHQVDEELLLYLPPGPDPAHPYAEAEAALAAALGK